MDTRKPKANTWIQKKALEIGLEGNQFVSAVAYAGNEGWLVDAHQTGLEFIDQYWRGCHQTLAKQLLIHRTAWSLCRSRGETPIQLSGLVSPFQNLNSLGDTKS